MFKPGDTVGDHEILARLKSGGMATLYLARRVGAAGFSRPVAIKVVHAHLSEDPKFVSMFVDEALLCARIDHPNVVRVDQLRQHRDHYYLVMEYVHGCALSALLKQVRSTDRRLSPELAVAIVVRVADGLHAAHELLDDEGNNAGVVHRDVTPSNVLLGYRGEVKLIDFGIAKASGRGQATQAGMLKGKISYMSPEQAFGRAIDRRTDVYALGILAWEAITTRRLFDADNEIMSLEMVRHPRVIAPSAFAPDVPPELDSVVLAALQPDPARRPQTTQELRHALLNAMPQAISIDSLQLSGVVTELMADAIEKDRQVLPSSLFTTMPSGSLHSASLVGQLVRPAAAQRAVTPSALDPGGQDTAVQLPPNAVDPRPRAATLILPAADAAARRRRRFALRGGLVLLGAGVFITAGYLLAGAAPERASDRPSADARAPAQSDEAARARAAGAPGPSTPASPSAGAGDGPSAALSPVPAIHLLGSTLDALDAGPRSAVASGKIRNVKRSPTDPRAVRGSEVTPASGTTQPRTGRRLIRDDLVF